MSTFSIQIDATQLVYRDFIIPGKTDWISSRTIQTLNLEPAGYNFQVGSGYYTDFTFSVTPAGTVDYDASFNAFLSGRGSTTLTIAGFPVTLDARNLSGAGVLLVIPATNEDWISYKTCRMVPASYYSVQQGSGEVTSFDFKLGLDGTFSYDPSYDSSRGGFLAGSGTSTLKFLGYPILVDARAAGGTSLTILPIWGMPSSPTSVQLATLLPAPSFVLYISGAATKAVFSLDVHGNFSFDSSLSPYLELQTFQGLPIIDPDVIGPPDFRQPVAGQAPYELWQQRRSWVDSTLATLKSDREAHDFTFILKEVLGDPLPDLATLKWNLEQGVDIDNTLSQIKALHFTVGSFLRLMTIKAKDDAKQPVQETEWEEIYAILTQVMKVGQFTAWRAEELAKGIILGPQDFWIALKEPKLTLWLATTQDRSTWQQALIARSQPPIIDPDLIGPGDMNNPGGDPAYHLWRARSAWVDTQLSPLQASPQTADGLDAIIQSTLGVPATELVALATERDKGNNINARLAQLTLSNEAFVTLLRMRDLVASGVPVLDSEWADVYSILVQVQKQRTFAVWRQEEHDQHIVLGPDLFQVQAPPSADSPPAQPLPAWRATQEARNNWQDTLQSRIDQEQTVITELQNAVSATEEVTLPLLRNALILATDVVGTGLEKSRWITEHLLIDAEADSCQVTTRIAQAIETVQGILFSVRTDQFKQNFIEPGSQLAAFSSTRNFFDVFVQGTDNGLDVIEFNNGQAFSNSFGGTWTSGPAVTIDRASGGLFPEMHFLIRGTDQAIWHKWFDGGKWNDWESLGGVWTSGPAAAFWRTGSTRQRHLDVFARGADSALWHNWFDGSWHSWESLGGTLTSGPAAASWGAGHLDVFARGSYNTLLHRAFDNNQWGNWESLGGALASAPSAVSWASNRIDVFAQGNDDTLQHMWFDGSWHDWESLGGTLTSGPAASSWDVSQLDVFVQGTDNTLQHKQFDGSWHDWETLPLPPLLTVDDDNFDDEWKWLGSYATWRARALTVLYPENILLPSLRPDKQQTRHFSTLVDQARMNPSFTPLQACELANQYSDYLHDVCNLDIEASCLVSTPTDQGDCLHKRTPPSERPLLYLFARTPWGRAYYSTYDRHGVPYDGKDVPDYGQSAWDTIPGFDTVVVEELLGAVPYLPNEEQQQILLFARVQEKGVTQLVFTTYDLLTQRWTGNIYPLELPSDASYFSVAVEQRDFDTNIPPLLPPLVAIATFPRDSAKGPDGQPLGSWNYIFVRRLNADATGWDSHDFYPVAGNPYVDKEKVSSVLALVSGGDRFYTVFFKGRTDEGGQDLRYGSLEYVILATPPFYIWTSSVDFPINITYAYVGSPASGVTAKMLGHPILDYPGQPATLGHFAVHCGVDQTQVGKLVAYQDTKTGASRAVFKLAPNFSASPAPSDIASVAPSSTNVPFDLTEHLSEAELQARADALMQVFTAAQNDPPTNLIYFEEAFFFIPILFALQLQQSGEYTAALDWFRTVYDYTTLQGKRLIYYGFLTQQPPDPLEDQLNPHIIAQGRPGSYLRFTLISLVRCSIRMCVQSRSGNSVVRLEILNGCLHGMGFSRTLPALTIRRCSQLRSARSGMHWRLVNGRR